MDRGIFRTPDGSTHHWVTQVEAPVGAKLPQCTSKAIHTHTHTTRIHHHTNSKKFPLFLRDLFKCPTRWATGEPNCWCAVQLTDLLPTSYGAESQNFANSRVLRGFQIEHPRLTPKTPDCKFYEGDMHGSHPPRANKEEWCIRRVTTGLQGIVYAQFSLSWDFHSAIHRRNALFLWF